METSGSSSSPSHVLRILESLRKLLEENPQATNLSNNGPVLPKSIHTLPNTSLPRAPSSFQELLTHLSTHILPYLNGSSLSPNYYGFVTGGATPAALTADILVSIFDQNVAVHLPTETIATNVEVAALNMLLDIFNLPREIWGLPDPQHDGSKEFGGSGIFTTGATSSNILGLALGREWVLSQAAESVTGSPMSVGECGLASVLSAAKTSELRILSTMPHSSIVKAASIVGIGRANVISIASSSDPLTIDLEKLEAEAKKPATAHILTISSGEVNTGRFATESLAQMQKVRKICDQHGIWIHVDGAFGLFGRVLMDDSAMQKEYAEIVSGCQGIEFADSITGDGHKLLNVSYDCGFFFTRHRGLAEEVFRNGNAAYLISGAGASDGISSPLNIGLENSRRFRGLPVYATLLQYGRQGYVEMLQRQIGLAREVSRFFFESAKFDLLPAGEDLEVMLAKTFMVVLFRAKDESLNKELVKRINATNKMYVTGTAWDGRPAARIAVSNWQVDIKRDAKLIREVLEEASR